MYLYIGIAAVFALFNKPLEQNLAYPGKNKMETVLIFFVASGFIAAFCALQCLVSKQMDKLRRKIARKIIMRQHL